MRKGEAEMHKMFFVALVLFAILGLACSFSLGGDSDGANGGDTGGGTESNVLFQDDFSNTGSGWDRSTFDEGSSDYSNGEYRIFVNTTSYSVWANPNQTSYTDTRVEVDATKTGGPDDNEFGIICRHSDPSNYYAAVISSDGFFGFWKRVAGADLELVGMTEFGQSAAINQGSASNHLRLDCVGSTLTLYANGTLLGSVTDTAHSGGDVGLYAGTFDEVAGTEILFDNFVVYQP